MRRLELFALALTLAAGAPTHAGDLLRGGAAYGAPSQAANSYGASASVTAQARANANDALARTTQALQAVKAMQSAARGAALAASRPAVPDGLTTGGLQLAPNAAMAGAAAPVQSVAANGQTTVTVTQNAQQALLNWQTFNIGKNTTLNFDQSAGGADASQWVAFNKINDPSGVPSQILGSIRAQGQVYVINQNGILFGGGSQVNVHTLVASSLPINDNLVNLGLLNNPDLQFLFTALPQPAGQNGTPAFNPPAPLTANGRNGDVVVEAGAVLSAPATAAHIGGRIALIGPNVTNAGTISAPDGQTILAAGLEVGFFAHASSDPSLRGLDVYVGAMADTASPHPSDAGVATNSGLIEAAGADVTIAGRAVNQLGGIDGSTSVSLNGRVDLLADYGAAANPLYNPVTDPNAPPYFFQSTGQVTLGPGSVTRILPELSSADRVVGSELALPSQINIQGRTIHMASNALILAPNGNITLGAGDWLPANDGFAFENTGGQVYLDSGALIYAGGSIDVPAPVSENIISVELRGSELADSPLQRDGALRGQTIDVDIRDTGIYDGETWQGTPLADTSGYVGLIERSVGELTIGGGSVKITAGNSVVMQPGSAINVSGGWIDYQGGIVQTTRVLSGGMIFDISNALPGIVYNGIYTGVFTTTDAKWGTSVSYRSPLAPTGSHYEAGYIEGGNGGSISITAPSMALDGNLLGNTVAGPRQRTVAPDASTLSLAFLSQDASTLNVYSPTPPAILFQPGAAQTPADAFALDDSGNPLPLRADRQAEVILSPALTGKDGFGVLSIDDSDGNIKAPANVTLATAAGGSITLKGANIDIEGKVVAPGGNLSFEVYDYSPNPVAALEATPPANPARGNFTLGSGATVSTAGLVVDDRPGSAAQDSLPLVTNGGAIAIKSYSADLAPGSAVDASGGVAISAAGKPVYGGGGSIDIEAGQDPNISAVLGGQLVLGANLKGYSGSAGSSLTILAPSIQIGGVAANGETLLLSPDFFSQGGFDRFTLEGLGAATSVSGRYAPGVAIAPGTVIDPVALNSVAITGPGRNVALTPILGPEGTRTPVSLSFKAPGVTDSFSSTPLVVRGDLVMGAGALIQTDPGGSVSLSGNTVMVLGSVIAPGGSITIAGGQDSTTLFGGGLAAVPTVDLGPHSRLSTAGALVPALDPSGHGYRTGSVLPGGELSISGNIVAEAGSVLDVSGATGMLDLAPTQSSLTASSNDSFLGSSVILTRVDSKGGSITLAGGQELFANATLLGAAGGPSAVGGSVVVSSGLLVNGFPTPLDYTLSVTQSPVPLLAAAIGNHVQAANGETLPAMGYVAADSFNAGGFESVALKGSVRFSGPVALTSRGSLAVADGGVIYADSAVSLTAPYVALGTPFQAPVTAQEQLSPFTAASEPFYFSPAHGPGSLAVTAGLIDIGNLSLQNIGNATFSARNGDIRGDGTLDVAGAITLVAGQIYPPTEVSFTIDASDYQSGGATLPGSVNILSAGGRQLPLSAGGELNIYASVINQGGVLRAPIGTINIGWNGLGTAPTDLISNAPVSATRRLTLSAGSVTSVSAVDPATGQALVIPYGINLNGTEWIDPAGTDITAGGAPGKAIVLSAENLAFQSGASVDIRGGGDLYAYRFVNGVGGTHDILASASSFAVIPGYSANYAPYGAYNSTASNLGGDAGYANSGLAAGEQVYLGAGGGLPAGIYTLLPARYALLPGAFLVTPRTGAPTGTVSLPDGSSLVSGYMFGTGQTARPPLTSFEVAPQTVVRSRAEYDDSFANTFLNQSAAANNAAVPLPVDSGHLVFEAAQGMTLQGAVDAGGPGGRIDISTPEDILIAGPGVTAPAGVVFLNSSELTSFGAESLLIGGLRTIGADSTAVTVQTRNLTVNNAGAPLSVQDLILVANDTLKLSPGAQIQLSNAAPSPAENLVLGEAATPGSGDGVLLRVSNDPQARISRLGVDSSTVPSMVIDAGARLSGASLILDSSYATSLSPDAVLKGASITLDSGQISIQLDNPGPLNPTSGLVLSGLALQTLQSSAQALSLLSYTSLDIYGAGVVGSPSVASLALHAAEFRGFNDGGSTVTFAAGNILLDNAAGGTSPGPVAPPAGTLVLDANTIELGANQLNIDQYAGVALNASGGILMQGAGGLATQGALTMAAPLLTGATGAAHTVAAAGALTLQPAASGAAAITGGLGANLTLQGASVTADSDIAASGGQLTLHATTGDLTLGGKLDAAGAEQAFFGLVEYTNGGQITLTSDAGNVNIAPGAAVTIAAAPGGGNAGVLSVNAPLGDFTVAGALSGRGGAGGQGGSFSLDVGSLPGTATLDAALDAASFSQSRSIRVRTGDVLIDGLATTRNFNISSDAGSITVSGEINAAGAQGGTITLQAEGSVTLLNGSLLTAAGQNFNDAGRGGAISLEAGSDVNGAASSTALVDIQAGSTIDLSVARDTAAGAAAGDFTGTLHIRAPQTAGNNDLQVNPINGSILNASDIVVEGYEIFNAANGSIDGQESHVLTNGETFGGNTGAIAARLLANNAALAPLLTVQPGAEIINPAGNLTLASNWDLSTYRFGPDNVAGDLTLRAAGNLIFNFKASLSDGFGGPSVFGLWDAPLLPVGSPSWSYRLVSGADFSAADFSRVQPLADLGAGSGSLLLGLNSPALPTNVTSSTPRSSIIPKYYQTIRTGGGDIAIYAGRDVQLLNSIATIYTAGSQAAALAGFDTPDLANSSSTLGAAQTPIYPAQYSLGGGNVTIVAQNDIAHYLQAGSGAGAKLVADSTKELPANWLYRQGYVDPATGEFGLNSFGDVASTSWWIDFSNFFEGVGALGGGNVTLIAGHNVSNVDAVAPTNARMPAGVPAAANLVELGGGDVVVRAGNNIDGGAYYVERGQGILSAGNQILTNSTRAALTQTQITSDRNSGIIPDPTTWLPTTLFLGDGSFDVTAGGNLLLGPVANPFLLPQGVNNSYLEKSYFSTYGLDAAVNVSSLIGDVTLKDDADGGAGSLELWFRNIDLSFQNSKSFAFQTQPWLRLAESNVTPFATVAALMPGTLRATAFSGDIDIVGGITLSPAPKGTIDLAAAGSINGLQINSLDSVNNDASWGSSLVNLSDADPAGIPGILTPISFSSAPVLTDGDILDGVNLLFNDSGSTEGAFGVIQTKQALNTPGLLHAGDSNPVHLYARSGDISGVTFFSSKAARILAGEDITDVALYLLNDYTADISLVAAGRDIIPYDPNSPLRVLGADNALGNEVIGQTAENPSGLGFGAPTAGDIQINGPGTLEVLAGRNLNLGVGPNNSDGTGVGITSVGNTRDPYLPFAGADIIAAAGIGQSFGLDGGTLDFPKFIADYLNPATGGAEAARYLPDLREMLGLSGAGNDQVWNAFEKLPPPRQYTFALNIFYLVLRDAGRDHNIASSPGFGNYTQGYSAIAALFPAKQAGDISLTSREIKTESGGNISLFAPGGQLTVGFNVAGSQPVDQGILTEDGGDISIFTDQSVNVGASRIFTLRGGNEIIWSSFGNIAAGASSKTVQSAPPTRVLIDPQSGDVQTDLAGLATGGGIGVLETVAGVPPANVDLIAPAGAVDAGDAGIRASGNLNIAALHVVNAGNIQVGGASAGVPTTVIVAPNIAGLTAASTAAGAASNTAGQTAVSSNNQPAPREIPSIITVEVLGYGGDDGSDGQ